MKMTKYYLIQQEQWKGQYTTSSRKSNENEKNTTWSSKSNGKDKILPVFQQRQWKGKNTTWSSKSNGKDKLLPDLARAMEQKGQNTTWSSKSNGKDKIPPGLVRAMERTK